MPSTKYLPGASRKRAKLNGTGFSPFDELASEYNAWFDLAGSLIFFNEVQALWTLLPSLPKPFLEIGAGY